MDTLNTGFCPGTDCKEHACNAGDPGWIPGSGRPPGEGNGYPLQYSCLENPKDGGGWWATVHGVTKSHTTLHFLSFLDRKEIKLVNPNENQS